MYKKIIKPDAITLYDLLTADTHGGNISIQDDVENNSYDLIPSRAIFFDTEGPYANVEKKGITLLRNDKHDVDLDYLLNEWNNSDNSCVVLIEGFAGCGKSTLVQYILLQQLKTFKYDYSFFNYDIEAQNNLLTHDQNGNVIKKSSIYEAIKKSFFEQFMNAIKINENIFSDFTKLLELCKEYPTFNNLYYNYYMTDTYQEIINNVKEDFGKNEQLIRRNLQKQTEQISSRTCLLALDYLLRLTMYKNRMLDKLYVCYDNLDAIEDAEDLMDFDSALAEFRRHIDGFIVTLQRENFFMDLHKPHFVIIATYRKITAVMANVSKIYKEVVMDRASDPEQMRNIYHIDATSVFSYREIVTKRSKFFSKYLNTAINMKNETKSSLLKELSSWNKLNQNLAIMKNRYACLWNKNYRTCSLIANELYREEKYQFPQYVNYIKNSKMNDGYSFTQDKEGNNILCSYYGSSAIILSSVCKVFNSHGIWDRFLLLAPLKPFKEDDEQPLKGKKSQPFYKQISLARIILTYMYNKNKSVSLKELFHMFCEKKLFPYKTLCQILANMLARNMDGVWRRPIYYSSDCILSENSDVIKDTLLNECRQLEKGYNISSNYKFILCDSGRSYVERLMQEFEFFSNRLSNENRPLYLCKNIEEIENIVKNVYLSVLNCCINMEKFRKEYIKLNHITAEQYLSLEIHPTTNNTHSPQLHTERIIFSHVAYLNNVRLYYIEHAVTSSLDERKEYNTMFVNYIEKYLNLYNEKIKPVTSKRAVIAEQLLEIVKEIDRAIEQKEDNLDVLFQSVSLDFHK